MMTTGMYTSATPEWATPQKLFDALDAEFHFVLDPCATADNAKCPHFYTEKENGLLQDWSGPVFMNPPYGRKIGAWIKKAWESAAKGTLVVCLVPARTDTAWWHDYCIQGEVRFIKGRLKFGGSKNSAPFPSAIVIFKGHPCTASE